MPNDTWPDWEQVLAAAARLQRILPGAVLVGGSAAAVYAASEGLSVMVFDTRAFGGQAGAAVRTGVNCPKLRSDLLVLVN